MDLTEQIGTESEDVKGKSEQDISEEEEEEEEDSGATHPMKTEPSEARALRSRANLRPPVRYQSGITATPYLAHSRSQSEPRLNQVGPPPGQMPLMVKRKALHYAPWSFMDLTGLIQRLPNMCEGAQKWITQFEEKTSGQHLAIGDIKAIFCQTVGKGRAEEIFDMAGI